MASALGTALSGLSSGARTATGLFDSIRMAWHRDFSAAERAAAPAFGVRARSDVVASVTRSLHENAPLIMGCAFFAAALFVFFGTQVAADTWLNVMGGREIVQHGLPHHDQVALVTQGRPWIDQQWLANLALYALYSVGGMSLAARVNVLLTVLLIGLVFTYARRQGASRLSVMLCSIPVFLFAVQFARAQVFVQPLLVGVVALLAAESRKPTRRILLVFPVLVLWANLHGSVVVATALVALLGATELSRAFRARSRPTLTRSAALIIVPWAFIFASPYGLELTSYYDSTVRNPDLPKFLSEWASPSFSSVQGIIFFALAGLAIGLIARHPRVLTPFELGILILTGAAGLHTNRSIVWFAFASGMLLPRLLDEARRTNRGQEPVAGRRSIALAGVIASLLFALHGLIQPVDTLATRWPRQGSALVEQTLRSDPNARVLASYDLADWVLTEARSARGRIAFDGRWEILSRSQLRTVRGFLSETGKWTNLSRDYRIIVLGPTQVPDLIRTFEGRPGVRVLYRTPEVVILDQGAARDRRP
jgi:hypothetical protein